MLFVFLIFETQQWKRVAQETVFPGSKAEKSCCSIVWTSEYQIHATVYLTTNSNQLKIDKKLMQLHSSQLVSAIQIDFKVTNIFFIHIALITNFSHYHEWEYSLIFVLVLSIRKFLFHRLDHSSLRKIIKILRWDLREFRIGIKFKNQIPISNEFENLFTDPTCDIFYTKRSLVQKNKC